SLSQQRSNLRRNSTARRHQANTVSAKFQSSLQELLGKMERFVVKAKFSPMTLKPEMFDMDLVNTQLLYCGIMETIRIRKQGYPARLAFHSFLLRYKPLLCLKDPLPADGENCVIMLHKLCPVKQGSYQVGVSKLLEGKRDRVLDIAAMTLQRYTRMCFVRQNFLKFRRGITRFEARCRGYLARSCSSIKSDRFPSWCRSCIICILVQCAPKVQVDPQLTLPLDINNYLMTHYIRTMFRFLFKCHTCSFHRFVSDYGPEGYDCVCQNHLLQALQHISAGPEYVRTYPPCLLEWTANRKKAHTVLHVHCLDGEKSH
ncbi:hypothetical protein XENOCAPTIV_003012, partial [Xenoophorus captivus]